MGSFHRRMLPAGVRIRVLVVDDSVVIRRLVAHALSSEPSIEVVGFAADGAAALRRLEELRPDVVTLDIEMPVMDGIETLRHLRERHPGLFVIMFSALTERGAGITIDALALGASDYIAKATDAISAERAVENLRRELAPKIRQFFTSSMPESRPNLLRIERRAAPALVRPRHPAARRVVAIGVSTGGPNALAEIMPMFPRGFGLPILIVQHMPAVFTRLLAERLDTLTPLDVVEAAEGVPVLPGRVLIAPGDHHMTVRRLENGTVAIAINENAPENSCRPSVDVLFRSVAEVYGGGVVAAVLTGMGYDGMRGAEVLHAKGAYVIAQDEASSVVWGMPAGVVNAGVADAVVDLRCVVPEILGNI